MQTTQLLELIELLAAAKNKTELARLKQTFGEEAITEAWEYLSDTVKRQIYRIASS